MTVDEVVDRLKEIGPYVRYDSIEVDGNLIHVFGIGDAPAGPSSLRVSLQVSDLGSLDKEDWGGIILKGKESYEAWES